MQMGAHEVWDIVSNMKQLVEKEPDKAKQMFVSHPQVKMRRVVLYLLCSPRCALRAQTTTMLWFSIHREVTGSDTFCAMKHEVSFPRTVENQINGMAERAARVVVP